MWMVIAQIVGIAAVALYLLSFQLKKRWQIISTTGFSYVFFVSQYLMLGAYAGAVMDALSAGSSLLASQKNKPWLRPYAKLAAVGVGALLVIVGGVIAFLRKDPIELLPIFGALLQTVGLWFNREQTIRKFGLVGAPFWLVYNLLAQAYGAAVGTLCVMASIIIALVRYHRKENE